MSKKGVLPKKRGFWGGLYDDMKQAYKDQAEKANKQDLRTAGKCYIFEEQVPVKPKEAEESKEEKAVSESGEHNKEEKEETHYDYRNDTTYSVGVAQEGSKATGNVAKDLGKSIVSTGTVMSAINFAADKLHLTAPLNFVKNIGYLFADIALGRRTRSTAIILAGAAAGAVVGAAGAGVGAFPGAIVGGVIAAAGIIATTGLTGMGVGYAVSSNVLKKEAYSDLSTQHTIPLKNKFGLKAKTVNKIGAYVHNRAKKSGDPKLQDELNEDFTKGMASSNPDEKAFNNIIKFLLKEEKRLRAEKDRIIEMRDGKPFTADQKRAELARFIEISRAAAEKELKQTPFYKLKKRAELRAIIDKCDKDLVALSRTAEKEHQYVVDLLEDIRKESSKKNEKNENYTAGDGEVLTDKEGKPIKKEYEDDKIVGLNQALLYIQHPNTTPEARKNAESERAKKEQQKLIDEKEGLLADKVKGDTSTMERQNEALFLDAARKITLKNETLRKESITSVDSSTPGLIIVNCQMKKMMLQEDVQLVFVVDAKNSIIIVKTLKNMNRAQVDKVNRIALALQNNIETTLGLPLTPAPESKGSKDMQSVRGGEGDNASTHGSPPDDMKPPEQELKFKDDQYPKPDELIPCVILCNNALHKKSDDKVSIDGDAIIYEIMGSDKQVKQTILINTSEKPWKLFSDKPIDDKWKENFVSMMNQAIQDNAKASKVSIAPPLPTITTTAAAATTSTAAGSTDAARNLVFSSHATGHSSTRNSPPTKSDIITSIDIRKLLAFRAAKIPAEMQAGVNFEKGKKDGECCIKIDGSIEPSVKEQLINSLCEFIIQDNPKNKVIAENPETKVMVEKSVENAKKQPIVSPSTERKKGLFNW